MQGEMTVGKPEMLKWLSDQLCKEERSLIAREQGARIWRGGTDETWRSVGCRRSKSERFALADIEDRIAAKHRKDIEILKAIIRTISDDEAGYDEAATTPNAWHARACTGHHSDLTHRTDASDKDLRAAKAAELKGTP